MDCPSCGNAVREGAHFCPSCGGPLAVAEPPPPITAKGSGTPLPPLPPTPTAVAVADDGPVPGAPSNTRWIAAAVGAAVVALLVVIVVVALSAGGDETQTATTGTVAPTGPTVAPATTAPPTRSTTGSDTGSDTETTAAPVQSVDREEEAHQEIDRLVAEGEQRVDAQMGDRWIPQVSSKRLGLEADGITYSYQDILNHFTQLRQRFGDLIVINSSDFSSFELQGWYVALAPETFGSSQEALGWCSSRGMNDRNLCFAKLVSRTLPYSPGTTDYP